MLLVVTGVALAIISGGFQLFLLVIMYLRAESVEVTSRGWVVIIISFIVMLIGIALALYAFFRK
jgi:hypothetical protein